MSFKKVPWKFQELISVAKDIKPPGWVVVVNKWRISFMEVSLGQDGPAVIEKQLILDQNLESQAFVGSEKVDEDIFPFKLSKLQSSRELYACLNLFSSYGVCQGNRNFKRIDKNGEISVRDYWKDGSCTKVFNRSLRRPENCCDACLQLNHLLPKKINNTYLSLSQPALYKSEVKIHLESNTDFINMERQKSGKRKKPDTESEIKKRIKQELEETSYVTQFVEVKEEPPF